MSRSMWTHIKLNNHDFSLLDLDHPEIEALILAEIDSGVDVYYDRRWKVTETFCRFLLREQEWLSNRLVLVIGAGIGMETLIVGRLSKKLYINDHAPIALKLCSKQLRKNGIYGFETLPGSYESLEIPQIDIVVGCYLVYNTETLKTMQRFFDKCSFPILLMNENDSYFQKLIKSTYKNVQALFLTDSSQCIQFS
jgi:predicted nicotinamide N-methyase